MLRRLALTLAITVGFASSVQAADADAAKKFVDTVAAQVIAIAKDSHASQADKQAKIETIFTDKVDISSIAKFVLGKNWRTATPDQQSAYVSAYKPFILKNYAQRLAKYSGETYTLKNAHPDGDAAVVTMAIHGADGQDVMVDYWLKGGSGAYKIVDIAVEGVSMRTTQRSEFNSIVENKGIDGLIEALKKQVAAKG